MCLPHHLRWFGGKGYGHLLTNFVPMLREVGVTQEQIDQIQIANPAAVLAIR